MAKVRVQDATRELSAHASKVLDDVARLRKQSQEVLGSLRRISDGFVREERERQERAAKEELQKQYEAAAQFMTAYSSQQAPEPMLSAGMVSPISLGEGITHGSVTSVRIIGDSIMAGVGALGYERPDGDELFTYWGTTYREPSKDADCASNRLRAYLEE